MRPWGLTGSERSEFQPFPLAGSSVLVNTHQHTHANPCLALPPALNRLLCRFMSPPVPLDHTAPLSPTPFWAGIFWEQHGGGMRAPGVGTGADIPSPELKNVDMVSSSKLQFIHLVPQGRGGHRDPRGTRPSVTRLGNRFSLFRWPLPLNLQICWRFLGKIGKGAQGAVGWAGFDIAGSSLVGWWGPPFRDQSPQFDGCNDLEKVAQGESPMRLLLSKPTCFGICIVAETRNGCKFKPAAHRWPSAHLPKAKHGCCDSPCPSNTRVKAAQNYLYTL